ncbi:MAG: HD domain-containing protein [Patescibacteria group bacterium]|jgi:tRNA nucleotidyltransferase (CCA-adding enzyme)
MPNSETPEKIIPTKEVDDTAVSLALPENYIAEWQERGLEKQAETYEAVTRICRAVQEAGGRALLVGGSVRDILLDVESKDFDIEVYGLEADKLEGLLRPFGRLGEVGKAFSVLKLSIKDGFEIDVSLPRRDSKTESKRGRGISAQSDPYMSISEATRRRDFTINAILADPLTGQVFDPYHGIDDLKNKTLRIVDEKTFSEDPVRVLRAMQMIGRFDLTMDEDSRRVMSSMADSLKHLSEERIYEEWRKLLLKSDKPSRGLQAGVELGVFKELHPEFLALQETPQDPKIHPEGNVWEHTLLAVDEMMDIARREKLTDQEIWPLMLATLCHDLGKAKTTEEKDGKIIAHGHDLASVGLTKVFLDSIRVDGATEARVLPLVRHHMRPMYLYNDMLQNREIKDGVFRRLARDLAPSSIRESAFLSEADYRATRREDKEKIKELVEWLIAKAESIGVDRQVAPEIMWGRDFLQMGFAPGPEIGRLIYLSRELRDNRGFSQEDIIQVLSGIKDVTEAMGKLEKLLLTD